MTIIVQEVNGQTVVSNDLGTAITDALLPQVAAAQTAQGLSEDARDLAQGYASDAAGVSGVNVPSYASRASLGGATVAAAIKQISTRGYTAEGGGGGANYVRTSYADIVSGGYPAAAYQRSTDRIMPDGSTDATNGGYWLLNDGVVDPAKFGAAEDGITSDKQAVVDMLIYASITGAKMTGTPGAKWLFDASYTFTRTATDKPIQWNFGGGELILNGATLYLGASPTPFLSTTLAADVARGASHLDLASVAGVAEGDLIVVESPALMMAGQAVRHTYIVTDITGVSLYIQGTVVADITAQQVIDSGTSGSIVVKCYKLYQPLSIDNACVTVVDPTGVSGGVAINGASSVRVKANSAGRTRSHFIIQYFATAQVLQASADQYGYVEEDQYYSSNVSDPSSLAFGYGVLFNYGWVAQVAGGVFGRGWHGVDSSVGVMNCIVDGAYFGRNAYGVDGHAGSWYLHTKNCIFDGGGGVNAGRSIYYTSENDTFRNLNAHGIIYSPLTNAEVRIKNPTFDAANTGNTGLSHIYRDGTGSARPGAISVGHERVFAVLGGTIEGNRVVRAGFRGTGTLLVKGASLARGATLEAQCQDKTDLLDLRLGDGPNNAAISAIISGNHRLTIKGAKHKNGEAGNPSLLLFVAAGGTAPIVDLIDITTDSPYAMFYAPPNIPIRNVINCVNVSGRLLYGDATNVVTNVSNCAYKTALSVGGIVVTTDHGNNKLLT